MAPLTEIFFSLKLTKFYMKIVGFWYHENERENLVQFALRMNTVASIIIALSIQGLDFYQCWGNFEELLYNICITSPVIVIAIKLIIFICRREALIDLIIYTEKKFWNFEYDEFGKNVINQCEKQSMVLLCFLSFAAHGTVYSYIFTPIYENIGKNETERTLPFRLTINFPVTETPYYEIIYLIQTLAGTFSGICFFVFDNLLGILNIHVVGQFRILQNRLENLCNEYADYEADEEHQLQQSRDNINSNKNSSRKISERSSVLKLANDYVEHQIKRDNSELCQKTYEELMRCVEQHLLLIDYVKKLDYIFNLVLLCEVGISSVFICITGFQILIAKRFRYTFHFMSAFIEMLMFTWTGNSIIEHSEEIGKCAFRLKWYLMPNNRAGRSFRRALILVMIRAERACYISAGKFAPISLESFTSIISTTLSYLSLMRKLSDDANA